jgi:hypothetical protein
MTGLFSIRIALIRTVLALGLAGLMACQPPPSTSGDTAAPSGSGRIEARVEGRRSDGPPRDLAQDEAAGGHVLRKHVGRTDDELRDRLRRERNISGSSTYTERATAERAIGDAIVQSHAKIERWLSRSGGRPNLVLDYDSDQPLGRTMNRGDSQSRPCSHAVIVLKYDPPANYHVLTSYPECR